MKKQKIIFIILLIVATLMILSIPYREMVVAVRENTPREGLYDLDTILNNTPKEAITWTSEKGIRIGSKQAILCDLEKCCRVYDYVGYLQNGMTPSRARCNRFDFVEPPFPISYIICIVLSLTFIGLIIYIDVRDYLKEKKNEQIETSEPKIL